MSELIGPGSALLIILRWLNLGAISSLGREGLCYGMEQSLRALQDRQGLEARVGVPAPPLSY